MDQTFENREDINKQDDQENSQNASENKQKTGELIRVLFVGDKSVGKTSIIHYIVTDMFPKNVERTFKTTTLETNVKQKSIKTVLIDSSTD